MSAQTFSHERNYGCRIREIIYRGHRCVSMENEFLRVFIAADKGADILEFLYKPLDVDFLWHSYHGLRATEHFRPGSALANGNFREHFAGGWFEMLPNGPLPCAHRGAEFGHHGEATLLPWNYQIETDEPEKISVKFWVRLARMPLLAEKKLTLTKGSSTLQNNERLTNESGQPLEILWGQHPTFGEPFLESGCRVFLPPCKIISETTLPNGRIASGQKSDWPKINSVNRRSVSIEEIDLSFIPGPETKSHDFVRLEEFSEGWFALVNPRRKIGFALRWDAKIFPVLGFWQVYRGAMDYPYYGTNYAVALEPACDLPSLSEAARKGTAIVLDPGAPLETTFEATAFCEPLTVNRVQTGGVIL
jgi:hypothetical protein